jgi:UDPglucose--hexose-1-phosphate uridylyltransferase
MRDSSGEEHWQVRGFSNKYPALDPNDVSAAQTSSPLFLALPGRGEHQVLVETPVHNRFAASRTQREMVRLMEAYQQRHLSLMEESWVEYVLVFKNHGQEAGTSQEHPHSQIIASPIMPDSVQRRGEAAQEHYHRTGTCLMCQVVEEEVRSGRRVVFQEQQFIVFHPFAASRPAETWIVPSEHQPSFAQASGEDVTGLASALLRTLKKLSVGFGDPDFNYVLHTSPKSAENQHPECWHWYLQIIPRMSTAAGFELGSGIFINTMPPEETASIMREAKE